MHRIHECIHINYLHACKPKSIDIHCVKYARIKCSVTRIYPLFTRIFNANTKIYPYFNLLCALRKLNFFIS